MSETYDAVIIGSGFGGSINALRLAAAGHSVLVLERGRRYAPADFPRDIQDVDSVLWRYPKPREAQGLFDLRMLSGVITVSASGVGGGSLVYASIHYRPQAVIFEDPRWPDAFNLDSLDPYYRKVSAALGVETVPTRLKLAKRDAFHRAAATLGHTCFDTPQAVSWDRVFGAGEGRQVCQLCAECEFGCPYGAKNTLDFTYLAEAEAHGARVRTHAQVGHIAPARVASGTGSGSSPGWAVHYEDTNTGEPAMVVGRRVVVAAGTLGTTELLLRSRDLTRTLPKISSRLGHGYSANGDFLGNIQNADTNLEPWIGPDVTSVMLDFERSPGFTMATPTFNKPVMEFLASLGQREPAGALMRRLAGPTYGSVDDLLPWVMKRGLLSGSMPGSAPNAGPADRFVTVFAIGQDNANGRLRLRDGALDLEWNYESENRELIARQEAAMRALAEAYGGTYGNLPTWDLYRRIMTVHNLGGCALSYSGDDGVVGIDGQVHGHPGLYVADGSVIPTAIGSHPVMTISAVSEWIAERVVASYASAETGG